MIRHAPLLAPAAILAVLTACGPQTPPSRATAERLCQDEARAADGISGRIGVGIGNDGPLGGGSLSINSNILNPRSEQDALRDCISRRIGGLPAPRRGTGTLTVGISGGDTF